MPPADILAHTANLWETYEKRLRAATGGKVHFPQKGLAEIDLGELKKVFEKDLPRALEALKKIKIDGKPLTYPHRAELDRLIAKVKRRDVAIEDIAKEAVPVLIKFALWLLYDVVMMLFDRLFRAIVEAGMPDVNPIKGIIDMKELVETIAAWKAFYDKVIAALNLVFEKLYWAADTQMMLAYSEDGVANSSGGGFIFKTAGKKQGTGLLHPGGTFCPLPIDHLEMGSDVRRDVSTFVAKALSGKHGQIR
jgi:hypothetical protein